MRSSATDAPVTRLGTIGVGGSESLGSAAWVSKGQCAFIERKSNAALRPLMTAAARVCTKLHIRDAHAGEPLRDHGGSPHCDSALLIEEELRERACRRRRSPPLHANEVRRGPFA